MKEIKSPTKSYLEALGISIKKKREKQGISLSNAASSIGLDPSNFQKIELGRMNLTVNTIIKISILLGIRPSDLFKEIPWTFKEEDLLIMIKPKKTKTKSIKKSVKNGKA